MNKRFGFGGFFRDYDIWYPRIINVLKSVSDAMAAFISEGLIQSFSLFVAWIFSIVIEVHRIELGMHEITDDKNISLLIALFLPIVLQLVQHMITVDQIEKSEMIEYRPVFTLRMALDSIIYRLGLGGTDERYKRLQPLKTVRLLIVISIVLLAFLGVAHDEILRASINELGEPVPWYEAIPTILSSPLDLVITWLAIIFTTFCAVLFEVTISHFVAIRSHNIILNLQQKGQIKLTERTSGNIKTFAELKRYGDGQTKKDNAWLYNSPDYGRIMDTDLVDLTPENMRFFDDVAKNWHGPFDNIKELRDYIKEFVR